MDKSFEGFGVYVAGACYFVVRGTAGEQPLDLGFFMVELEFFRSIDRAFGTPENDALGPFASKSFLGPLAYEVALNLCREAKCECKDFARDVVSKPITLFDSPDTTALVHADIEYLHDHEEVPPEAGKLGTDDDVTLFDFVEQGAQEPSLECSGAADGLVYPAVYGDAFSAAELQYFESLILDCLLVAADPYVAVVHNLPPQILSLQWLVSKFSSRASSYEKSKYYANYA